MRGRVAGAKKAETALILVHGECADGLTSAGLLLRRFPGSRYIATHPSELKAVLERVSNEPLPDRLILADLSPQASELAAIGALLDQIAKKTKVTWIDHHDPQWPVDFEKRAHKAGVEVVLDRTGRESGASLSAQWAQERDHAFNRVADLIRLRDAWVDSQNPDAMAWTLVAVERDDDYVQRLATGRLEGLEEEGRVLFSKHQGEIDAALKRVRKHSPQVAWLWGDQDISDVAHQLFARESAVVFLFRFSPSGRVSVRSRKPLAAKLSQDLGGGGHARAAGFTLRLSPIARIAYRVRRGRVLRVRAILERAAALAPP